MPERHFGQSQGEQTNNQKISLEDLFWKRYLAPGLTNGAWVMTELLLEVAEQKHSLNKSNLPYDLFDFDPQ